MTGEPELQTVAVDANVLIHMTQVEQVGLFGELHGFHFVVPQEVLDELVRPESRQPVLNAMEMGLLRIAEPEDVEELLLMTELTDERRIGRGEAACLTLASSRGWLIATDDEGRRFVREAESRMGARRIVSTPDLVLLGVRRGVVSLDEADRFPKVWCDNDFVVDFESFSQLLRRAALDS